MSDTTALPDLTKFQVDLLVAARDAEQTHGLGIKDFVGRAYGEEINHGRLYPNLDTLVDKGLLSKGQIDKRTNEYTLTERGERELEGYAEFVRE